MNNLSILAQAGDGQSGPLFSEPVTSDETSTVVVSDSNAPPAAQQRSLFGINQLFFFGLMILVMYFLLFRGPRQKKQQHKQMVQSLNKNDKIRTIGGIIGTIVDIKDDEITLKIDESNNTKIKIMPSAIGKNLSKEKS